MFKNKRFLYGLGMGLILGAALLQMMNAVPKAADLPNSTPENQTVAEITLDGMLQKVEDAGYQVFDKTEKIYTQTDIDQASAKVKTEWAFFVPPGMGPAELADLLFELKLIDSAESLTKALNVKQLNKKIQAKVYHFKEKPKLDDLILTLTTP